MRKNENEALLYETLYSLYKKEDLAFLSYNTIALKTDITLTLPEIINTISEVTRFSTFELSEAYYPLRNAFSAYNFDYYIIKEGDELWPKGLIDSEVHFLYCVGNIEALSKLKIAHRGFRTPTTTGKEVTINTLKEINNLNGALLTTLDIGLDYFAANYALSENLPTIAVLASPLHEAVPVASKDLMVKIGNSNGALVTQFSPACKAEKWFTVPRNRLLLSLSDHFILAEEKDGGPLFNQAEIALQEKGRVFIYDKIIKKEEYTYLKRFSTLAGVVVLKRSGDLTRKLSDKKKRSRKKDDQLELF